MIKFALLGCGRISKRHAELLGSSQVHQARLVAVCDVEREKAAKLSSQYEVPYFLTLDEMLNSVEVDVVVVLTESGAHASNVLEIAAHKKHVIVEKPMALKLEDADKMIAACREQNVGLFVVKQNRFNVPVVKVREALEQGRFGKLTLGTVRVRWCREQPYYDLSAWRGTWALDGGVLANQASHHIDLLQWMLGDVESVFAMSATALANIEVEDTAIVNVRFKSGALGIIEATTATRPKDLEGSLSILGQKGSVEIGGFAVNELKTWQFEDKRLADDDVLTRYSVNPPNVYGYGHKEFYQNVISSLNFSNTQAVDGVEGRKSLALIHAIYKSIETGQVVHLSSRPLSNKLGVG